MAKYRHTFYLIDGKELSGYTEINGLCHITFGKETAFFLENEGVTYTIPFFSVGYIETEELE